MPSVKKLDSKRRAVFPDKFSPGDTFIEEIVEDRIIFRLIEPDEVPAAGVYERDGRLFVKAPLDRAAIAKAIRKERDSR